MRLVKVLCAMLVVFCLVSPNSTKAEQSGNVNEVLSLQLPEKYGVNKTLYTSTGALFVLAAKYNYNEDYSELKVDFQATITDGKTTTKKIFLNSRVGTVMWEDKLYILSYDDTLKQLTVYDEAFNLIDTQPVTLDTKEEVEFQSYNEFVAIHTYTRNEWWYKRNRKVVVYDLKKKQFATNVKAPYSHAEKDAAGEIMIHIVDQLGRITATYDTKNYDEITAKVYSDSKIFEYNDQLTFVTSKWNFATTVGAISTRQYEIITMSKEGYIINIHRFDQVLNRGLLFFQHNNLLQMYDIDSTQEEEASKTYGYDLNTFNLYSGGRKPYFMWNQIRLNADYYFDHYRQNNQYINVVKTNNHEELYSFDHVGSGFPVSNNKDYMIYNHQLQRIENGQTVHIFTSNIGANVVYEWMDEDSFIMKKFDDSTAKTTISLYSLKSQEAPKDAVSATKKWTVLFSKTIDESATIANYIYVTDANGNKVESVNVKLEGKKAIVTPPSEGYTKGDYVLHVEKFQLRNGKALSNPQTKTFTVQ